MPVFLSHQELSRDGLKLRLSNDLGQEQDAVSVTWTVYGSDGSLASGMSLPATKVSPGRYYAPYITVSKSGSYTIVWEITEWPDCFVRTISDTFFIVDPSAYSCAGFDPASNPAQGSKVFLSPSWLSSSDLTIKFTNQDGFPQDPYAVFWTVVGPNGCPIYTKTAANPSSLGTFFAQFLVNFTGEYTIKWEWQDDENSPLRSKSESFSAISSSRLSFYSISGCHPIIVIGDDPFCNCCSPNGVNTFNTIQCAGSAPSCGLSCSTTTTSSSCNPPVVPAQPPVSSMSSCCSFELPRSVHISYGVLPSSGQFTDQTQYQIGTGIRKITFYITYQRGAAGGSAIFRLLWGNGVEEIQETILDLDVIGQTASTQSQNLYLQDLNGPTPDDTNPISFVLYTTVPGGSTRVRLIAAEKGSILFPGNLGVTVTAST